MPGEYTSLLRFAAHRIGDTACFDVRPYRRRVLRGRDHLLAACRSIARHTVWEWNSLCSEFYFRCACCGLYLGRDGVRKDHILPIVYEGASDGIHNLQPLCQPCNSAKRDRDCFNWVWFRRDVDPDFFAY